MKQLINRLDLWLRSHRIHYYRNLLPGVTESELRAFEDSLGFQLPQSFIDLYMWRNGQTCSNALQYNREWQSLDAVQESRNISNGCLEGGDFDLANWWSPKWIPFLHHFGGDLLCLDMDGTFAGVSGQIVYFYHDSADRVIAFPSLEKWLEGFVITLEENMWEENKYGFQPKDNEAVLALCKQLNPGYPCYKSAG